jgi:uncharacterized protein
LEATLPVAMLLLGLASGVHCVAMCGGIVGAFSTQRVAVPTRAAQWRRQLAFNLGRISTYGAAGALVGAMGAAGVYAAGALPAQTVLYVMANLMLILVGLYLAGFGGALRRIESLGVPLWRRLQPLAARLLPKQSGAGAFAAGALWGWLPCGLVYGALAAAAFSATPQAGALAMLAFGLGTTPNLLVAGFAAARVRAWMTRRPARIAAGGVVLAFGTYGLVHAAGVGEGIRRALVGA